MLLELMKSNTSGGSMPAMLVLCQVVQGAQVLKGLPAKAALIPESSTSDACSDLQAFDPFEVLVQPGPSANFKYSWTSFASVRSSNETKTMVMSVDDSVPCCIPVNLTGAPPTTYSKATGRRLGLCDLRTNRGTYSLNWDVFNMDLTNMTRAGQVQALIKSPTPMSGAGPPAPATRGERCMSLPLLCPCVLLFRPFCTCICRGISALSAAMSLSLPIGMQKCTNPALKSPGSKAVAKVITKCSLCLSS